MNDKVQQATERLTQGLDALADSEAYRKYLDTCARFHRYSAGNVLLIMLQRPDATHVAGFEAWKRLGRHVKAGEHGITILAPCPHRYARDVEDVATGETRTEVHQWLGFTTAHVFDVSQTEGKDLPPSPCQAVTDDVDGYDALLARIIAASPVPVSFATADTDPILMGAQGYFEPDTARIVVLAGMSQVMTIRTTIHEVAHALLHGHGCPAEALGTHMREVQAESVAYIVAQALGLDTAAYSLGYVQGWGTGNQAAAGSASKAVLAYLGDIQKTAAAIIDAVTPQAQPVDTAAAVA